MNQDLRKESLLVIAGSRDAAPGALHFIETTRRWPRRVLGDPPSEPEMEAVEFEALKLQRKLDHRKKRKRQQRRGVTVQGVTILPSDLVPLMLASLSGRTTVNWRDRKAGFVEINPTEVLEAVLTGRESRYDDEATKWSEIDAAASENDLPPRPEPPRKRAQGTRDSPPND